MRYSIVALLILVAVVALACFVSFVAPPVVRVPMLFAAVLVIPAPLVVLLRQEGRSVQSFAFGGLAAYAAWLVLGGLPCFALVAYRFTYEHNVSLDNLHWEIDYLASEDYYTRYVGLYGPWVVVPVAGAIALMVHWLVNDGCSEK